MTKTRKRPWGTIEVHTSIDADRYFELKPKGWAPRVKVYVRGETDWRKDGPSVTVDWSCMGVDIARAETFAKMLAEGIRIAKKEAKRVGVSHE